MNPVYIHQLATAVPPHAVPQAFARDTMKAQLEGNRLAQRLVHRLYSQSGIDTRYSVIPDFLAPTEDGARQAGSFLDADGRFLTPSTKVRNDLYTEAARPLFKEAAAKALDASPFTAADITHVVTVSCTGFCAPGPDYFLVRDLCLDPGVQRFHVGFMGCYAAFPALKMAKAFCQADPDAVVLVVCLELCTLHLQLGGDPDRLLASSVFADGAAAALISASTPSGAAFELSALATTLTAEGEGDMAWSIGDEGFDIVLSSYVPEILEANIGAALAPLFAQFGLAAADIERWGVHPGGRAILDKLERSLELGSEALEPSRRVLRDYGNMSSATVLFVLKRILSEATPGERVCAVAFGPGLTVESGLLTRC
jgi:predicted naringenin-chalcone synthase